MNERPITDVWSEVRRVIFDALGGLKPREQSRLAAATADALRDAGLLARAIEQHLTARQFARLINRCEEYVGKRCESGELSPVSRDDRGWMIPTSTAQCWLDRHCFGKSNRVSPLETGSMGENNSIKERTDATGLDGDGCQPGDSTA